jgi:pimeloyl-ACP methyl ester carboxylesterase
VDRAGHPCGVRAPVVGHLLVNRRQTKTASIRANFLELTDGRCLCWAEYGDPDGQPIFLFHGNPGSRLCWGKMPGTPFIQHARLVAPDRRGYGRTDFCPRALARWPRDIAELADRVGIGQFAVFGPSGGAPYALA